MADQEFLSGLGVIAAAGVAYLVRAMKQSKDRVPLQLRRMKALASAQKKLGLRNRDLEERAERLETEVAGLKAERTKINRRLQSLEERA